MTPTIAPHGWRYLAASVTGRSHDAQGVSCQDAHAVRVWSGQDPLLLVVCADGAGSAAFAATGARLACDKLVELVASELQRAGNRTAQLLGVSNAATLTSWFDSVRQALVAEAELLRCAVRELACTLVASLVGVEHSLFMQLGDGAIVVDDESGLHPVFWPAKGEYAAETRFVTDEDASENLLVLRRAGAPHSIAVFTDGLERLALDLKATTAHKPFFSPLFALLDEHGSDDIYGPFVEFLASDAVSRRSDDDKTLVLARRWPQPGPFQ